jgi:5-methylcytosine-specific restriction endonuclease McrA
MKRLRSRRRRLDPESYRKLCRQVLKRDGWRCQSCGRLTDLQVHHMNPRSLLGEDAEGNLITLCADCHRAVHLRLGSQR